MSELFSQYGPWLLGLLIVAIVLIGLLVQLIGRLRGGSPTAMQLPTAPPPYTLPSRPNSSSQAAASAGFFTSVVVNGQTYTSLDQMPPDVRQAYEQSMAVLADANQNGIPDILEQFGVGTPDQLQAFGAQDDTVARLQKLKQLLDAGIITPQEFEAKKAEILGRL
ncbi:MAG TPA: SHOCT domain-containing protein [Roseiflexaceae bacterium]|nr:SHOCT domain-containing protein [Roseiflexaceae bacterium]